MKRLIILAALALMAPPASANAVPPTITETTFSAVTTTSALLEATVNPGGKSTPYHFEYGTTDCEAGPCKAVPSPDASAGNGTAPVKLTFPLTGLTPNTTYHFRLLAKNSESPLDPETNEREYIKGPDTTFTTHALPPVFEPCPNEAFRADLPSAQLPDCRAYEQATPLNKNAGEATSVPWLQAAADDGDAVTFLSDAGFPDAEGAQDMPLYLATRGQNGWSSQGVLPSGTLAPHDARILGWLPDLSEVFSRAVKYGAPLTAAFLSRPGQGPGTRTIAPFTLEAGYAYADSSADERLVLYEEIDKVTGTSTLWLWDRTTDFGKEVSVLNDGVTPPSTGGAFAGPYDWTNGTDPDSLSEGGANRTYDTHDSNVLADDASSVIFTASETGQLYLRKNPTQDPSPVDPQGNCTDPALACTIQISRSRKTNGKKPDGTDSAGTRPAVFHAASADGRYTFFTSSEKLTNDANTGVEPEGSPAIASADLSTEPPSVDMNFLPTRATALASDDEFIYWVNPERESIGKAPLEGGEDEPGFIGDVKANGVAVDDTYIYWTEGVAKTGDDDGTGRISRANKLDGSELKPNFITGATGPTGIAVNGTHIFWADHRFAFYGGEKIMRADIAGGDPEVYGIDSEGRPAPINADSLALDAANLFVGGGNSEISRSVIRMSLSDETDYESWQGNDGKASTYSFGDPARYRGMAVDEGYVYWANSHGGPIGRVTIDGTQANQAFIAKAGYPQGLTLSGDHLYFSANQEVQPNPGADLYRYDSSTDQLTDLTVDTDSANGAEVVGVVGTSTDGSRVYFAANGVLDEEPNSRGESAEPGNCKVGTGSCNVYLAQNGTIRFIARVEVEAGVDVGTGSPVATANWAPTPSTCSAAYFTCPRTSRLSADGRYLLFTSSRRLTEYDNADTPVLYRYDSATDSVLCVSCNPSGERPHGVPRLTSILRPSTETPGPSGSFLSKAFSADGSRVFFETTDGLVGSDLDGLGGCPAVGSFNQNKIFRACQDVYQWQAPDTYGCERQDGCLYLLSPGDDASPSFFAGASASGDDAFIFTRAQLVGSDRDQLRDVYDLRVSGGLASQYPVPPVICDAANSCKLGPATPPNTPSPGTVGFQGAADPPVKRARCPKGKVRKKGRCVKKAKRKRKHKKGTRR